MTHLFIGKKYSAWSAIVFHCTREEQRTVRALRHGGPGGAFLETAADAQWLSLQAVLVNMEKCLP